MSPENPQRSSGPPGPEGPLGHLLAILDGPAARSWVPCRVLFGAWGFLGVSGVSQGVLGVPGSLV